jgi:hypothetical protein
MRFIVILGLVVLAGCPKKTHTLEERTAERQKQLAPIVAKYKPLVEARVALYKQLGETTKAAPPIAAREPLIAKVTEPYLLSIERVLDMRDGRGKIAPDHIDVKNLENLMSDRPSTDFSLQSQTDSFEWFVTKPAFVAVVRLHEYTQPKVAVEKGFFTPGSARGDATLFELATQKKVGAFPFLVTQADTATQQTGQSAQNALQLAFNDDARKALEAELAAYLDGKPGPASVDRAPDTPESLRARHIQRALNDAAIFKTTFEIVEDPCKLTIVVQPKHGFMIATDESRSKYIGTIKEPLASELLKAFGGLPCEIQFRDDGAPHVTDAGVPSIP